MSKWEMPLATTAERVSITPTPGELIYDETVKAPYFGDGTAVGGRPFAGLPIYDIAGTSAGALLGSRAVALNASDQLIHPDRSVTNDGLRLLGISLSAASGAGQAVSVRRRGLVTEAGWSWNEGPVYVGDGGALTQSVPPSGWLCQIGTAITSTTVEVDPQPIIL